LLFPLKNAVFSGSVICTDADMQTSALLCNNHAYKLLNYMLHCSMHTHCSK